MRPSVARMRNTSPTAVTWPSCETASQWNLTTFVQPIDVVASPEAESVGADPLLVGGCGPRLQLGVSPRLERGRHADSGARGHLADLLRWLEDLRAVLGPELGDQPAPALGVWLVPERDVSIRQMLCLPYACPGG